MPLQPIEVPWCEKGLLGEQDRQAPCGVVMWGGVTRGKRSGSPTVKGKVLTEVLVVDCVTLKLLIVGLTEK